LVAWTILAVIVAVIDWCLVTIRPTVLGLLHYSRVSGLVITWTIRTGCHQLVFDRIV
jgi:hypothetical protein